MTENAGNQSKSAPVDIWCHPGLDHYDFDYYRETLASWKEFRNPRLLIDDATLSWYQLWEALAFIHCCVVEEVAENDRRLGDPRREIDKGGDQSDVNGAEKAGKGLRRIPESQIRSTIDKWSEEKLTKEWEDTRNDFRGFVAWRSEFPGRNRFLRWWIYWRTKQRHDAEAIKGFTDYAPEMLNLAEVIIPTLNDSERTLATSSASHDSQTSQDLRALVDESVNYFAGFVAREQRIYEVREQLQGATDGSETSDDDNDVGNTSGVGGDLCKDVNDSDEQSLVRHETNDANSQPQRPEGLAPIRCRGNSSDTSNRSQCSHSDRSGRSNSSDSLDSEDELEIFGFSLEKELRIGKEVPDEDSKPFHILFAIQCLKNFETPCGGDFLGLRGKILTKVKTVLESGGGIEESDSHIGDEPENIHSKFWQKLTIDDHDDAVCDRRSSTFHNHDDDRLVDDEGDPLIFDVSNLRFPSELGQDSDEDAVNAHHDRLMVLQDEGLVTATKIGDGTGDTSTCETTADVGDLSRGVTETQTPGTSYQDTALLYERWKQFDCTEEVHAKFVSLGGDAFVLDTCALPATYEYSDGDPLPVVLHDWALGALHVDRLGDISLAWMPPEGCASVKEVFIDIDALRCAADWRGIRGIGAQHLPWLLVNMPHRQIPTQCLLRYVIRNEENASTWIRSVEECWEFVTRVHGFPYPATLTLLVGAEGWNLSRCGRMSVFAIRIAGPPTDNMRAPFEYMLNSKQLRCDHPYFFDITTLGQRAFGLGGGLGALLRSDAIQKVAFDARAMNDYFYHQCGGWQMRHVTEVQVEFVEKLHMARKRGHWEDRETQSDVWNAPWRERCPTVRKGRSRLPRIKECLKAVDTMYQVVRCNSSFDFQQRMRATDAKLLENSPNFVAYYQAQFTELSGGTSLNFSQGVRCVWDERPLARKLRACLDENMRGLALLWRSICSQVRIGYDMNSRERNNAIVRGEQPAIGRRMDVVDFDSGC